MSILSDKLYAISKIFFIKLLIFSSSVSPTNSANYTSAIVVKTPEVILEISAYKLTSI